MLEISHQQLPQLIGMWVGVQCTSGIGWFESQVQQLYWAEIEWVTKQSNITWHLNEVFSIRCSENKSFTARTAKQTLCAINFVGQRIHFQGQKSKIFMQWSLPFFQDPDYVANKSLFAGLIQQISCFLIGEPKKGNFFAKYSSSSHLTI